MKQQLIYHGHSCFEIIGRDRVIVDPFLNDNPKADIGPSEVKPDIIAVTHGHKDHLGDAVEISKNTDAPVVCIADVGWELSKELGNKVLGMNMGGSVRVKNTRISMVRADHSSGINSGGNTIPGGQAAGFIIDSGVPIYHMGDTALFLDMKIYQALYHPKVVLAPIGDLFTMDPKQASLAVEWLEPEIAVPMHYDTWGKIKQEPGIFKDYVEGLMDKKVKVLVPKPGESIELDKFLKKPEEE